MTQSDGRISVARANEMDHDEFVKAFGSVFEYAPWVASNTWSSKPFESVDGLQDALMQSLKGADRGDQIKFLSGHTDMQVTTEAIAAMTPDSQQEHIAAGFDKLTAHQQERIEHLVTAYRTRFGFPFVAALRGRNAAEILALAEQHLGNDSTDMELYFALTEVGKITRMRLDKLAV